MITTERDYCRRFASAMCGDRASAISAIKMCRRHPGPGRSDDAVALWVAWAGPVDAHGLPLSARTERERAKLTALIRDKLCLAGPCKNLEEVRERLLTASRAGDLRAFTTSGGQEAFDVMGAPTIRDAPRPTDFP